MRSAATGTRLRLLLLVALRGLVLVVHGKQPVEPDRRRRVDLLWRVAEDLREPVVPEPVLRQQVGGATPSQQVSYCSEGSVGESGSMLALKSGMSAMAGFATACRISS